jgi:hypothetical protein
LRRDGLDEDVSLIGNEMQRGGEHTVLGAVEVRFLELNLGAAGGDSDICHDEGLRMSMFEYDDVRLLTYR